MRPPLIGVTTSVTVGQTPERAYVNAAYLHAVQQAGGVPVALTPHLNAAARDALWKRMDGLLLTGGGDIAPERFGEAPHATVYDVAPERDILELELTGRALVDGVPMLAICRGIQVLNIALGGSLIQDLPTEVPGSVAHSQQAPRSEPTHDVKVVVEGTALGAIVESAELAVNSFHHQAIKRLGRGLREVAWAPDGVIEGVEMPDATALVLGVQWHPEDLVGNDPAARRLFSSLVQAALAR